MFFNQIYNMELERYYKESVNGNGEGKPTELRPQPVIMGQTCKFKSQTCKFMTNQLIFIGIDVIKKGFFQ